ncbi:AEC family transporter [Roseospira navarrensis]|uniref:AEC family transporter n=1 Tax=Roseospira navarrensis TaxID=140058 RepID=A0A7X1ZFC6_9PROT|nr:AEC family transporter [Roseospira navarrensis]MQX36210.1 AEC family transporter [Roseospira navarrensis]
MFSAIFSVVAPVVLIAGIGTLWARRGWPFDTQMVAALSTNLGVPCLVLDVLTRVELDSATLGGMALAAAMGLGFCAVMGVAILRATRQPLPPYLPALVFGNSGNMGLPLCLFAFGEPGLALAIAFFVVSAVLNFTAGVAIASGRLSLRTLLRTPVIWAVLVAVALRATDTPLPGFVANTVELLGGMTIPLMLLALGVALARLRPGGLGRAALLSALRLALGWSGGLLVVWLLGLEGMVRGIVLIEMAMPVAVFNYLFAQRFGNRPEEVAGMVLVSTLATMALLPVLLWLAWGGAPPPGVAGATG